MERNQKLDTNNQSNTNEEKRKKLKLYIEGATWLQAFGQLSEAILLSMLLPISEDPQSPGEHKILSGAWTQAIGLILIALGATTENTSQNKRVIEIAQKGAVTGSYLQGIGAITTGIGGTEVLRQEATKQITEFIP